MDAIRPETLRYFKLAQIAWVVKDLKTAEKFFKDTLGIGDFGNTMTIRAKDFEGTYYGKPSDEETLVSMVYAGGTFIELIQPVSGHGMFQEYLDQNPNGGMQHIAFSMPVAELDNAISELAGKGYPVIASYDTPIAKIVFIDSRKDIGLMTELMGITEEGEKEVEKMKNQKI